MHLSKAPPNQIHDGTVLGESVVSAEAFRSIVTRHLPALHRYAARRVGPVDADDIVAEAFAIAFRRRASFDRTRPDAAPWLYGILANVLHRHRRSEARRLRLLERALHDAGPDHALVDGSIDRLDAENRWASAARRLRRLPSGDREAFLLHALADLTYQEIGQALEIPTGTVASRINRARAAVLPLLIEENTDA